ncbi:hypothetical protein AVEN_126246-1 [Araneus ventricosus]|uniref:Uncharacterized protein n=1 Tax=Araneus ventricosus TaxID=182803 RepID=A0A4Y2L2Z8_ARAVE|nr:hypothetical protein AVEN_126246-1 [Araneus ventricosus]
MRSCRRSVCFVILMDSNIPPRVGRAWRPIRREVHFGPRCINGPVSQPLGWSAQGDQAKVVNFWGLALRVVNVPGSGPERIDKFASTIKATFDLLKDHFVLGLKNASSLFFLWWYLFWEQKNDAIYLLLLNLLSSLRSNTSAAINISSWFDVSRVCWIRQIPKSFCALPVLLPGAGCEIVSILPVAVSGNYMHSFSQKVNIMRYEHFAGIAVIGVRVQIFDRIILKEKNKQLSAFVAISSPDASRLSSESPYG